MAEQEPPIEEPVEVVAQRLMDKLRAQAEAARAGGGSLPPDKTHAAAALSLHHLADMLSPQEAGPQAMFPAAGEATIDPLESSPSPEEPSQLLRELDLFLELGDEEKLTRLLTSNSQRARQLVLNYVTLAEGSPEFQAAWTVTHPDGSEEENKKEIGAFWGRGLDLVQNLKDSAKADLGALARTIREYVIEMRAVLVPPDATIAEEPGQEEMVLEFPELELPDITTLKEALPPFLDIPDIKGMTDEDWKTYSFRLVTPLADAVGRLRQGVSADQALAQTFLEPSLQALAGEILQLGIRESDILDLARAAWREESSFSVLVEAGRVRGRSAGAILEEHKEDYPILAAMHLPLYALKGARTGTERASMLQESILALLRDRILERQRGEAATGPATTAAAEARAKEQEALAVLEGFFRSIAANPDYVISGRAAILDRLKKIDTNSLTPEERKVFDSLRGSMDRVAGIKYREEESRKPVFFAPAQIEDVILELFLEHKEKGPDKITIDRGILERNLKITGKDGVLHLSATITGTVLVTLRFGQQSSEFTAQVEVDIAASAGMLSLGAPDVRANEGAEEQSKTMVAERLAELNNLVKGQLESQAKRKISTLDIQEGKLRVGFVPNESLKVTNPEVKRVVREAKDLQTKLHARVEILKQQPAEIPAPAETLPFGDRLRLLADQVVADPKGVAAELVALLDTDLNEGEIASIERVLDVLDKLDQDKK